MTFGSTTSGSIPSRCRDGRIAVLRLLLGAALACACLGLTSCGGSGDTRSAPAQDFAALARATTASPPQLADSVLVRVEGSAVGALAVDSTHIVWESGPIQSDDFQPSVYERDLETHRVRVLAKDADPLYGLASTAGWVFYARRTPSGIELRQVAHGTAGGDRAVTTALLGPVASRGNVVAWAEQDGKRQTVVALDSTSGRRYIVARVPACTNSGCYRIGQIAIAEEGIVFTRNAIEGQPSMLVRWTFATQGTRSFIVPNDPQPDVVATPHGVLYYALLRGWFQLTYTGDRPTAYAPPRKPAGAILVGRRGQRVYLLVRRGCNSEMHWAAAAGRPNAHTLLRPRSVRVLAGASDGACVQLAGITWADRQPLTSWSLAPEEDVAGHTDDGLRGVIVAGSPSHGGQP
jgi:hypothetical protein